MARNSNPKERILVTATKLFYEQGYNATGINQVLEEAGVAKASLYQHYGSKEELGVAYLKNAREEWFAGLDQALAKKNTSLERVLACFDFLEYTMRVNNFLGCKFINMMAELASAGTAMRKEIMEHKAKLRHYMSEHVKEACKEAGTRNAGILSDTIYLLFEGAIVESKITNDTWPIKSARKSAKLLLGGA
jgi:AcrR family transcriptional regulator